MTEFVPTVAFAALVVQFINALRYATNRDVSGLVTIVTAWIAGVAVVMIGAHTDFAAGFSFGGVTLAASNFWTQLFVGLAIASAGSTLLVDFRKAIDQTDSAKVPSLVPSRAETTNLHP